MEKLKEIKTNYKQVENIELNGIELYFDSIPPAEERNILKNNGFKWNNKKSCWYIKKNKIESIELGKKEIENSYSGYGWKGVNSDKHLSITEIAKIIKQELKKKFPTATFSVTSGGSWSYSELNIYLLKDKINPLNDFITAVREAETRATQTKIIEDYDKWSGLTERDIEESEQAKKMLENRLKSGHIQINQYYIKNDYELSEYGKNMFLYIKELCDSFNYDDSDSMTDYFDCGFYLSLGIGKYNKDFELITKEG